MEIFIVLLGSVIVMMLLVFSGYLGGLKGGKKEIIVEINMFTSYYFNLGIFYNCIYKDVYRSIDQVTIGLFFINFNFVFYKEAV